jgi:DNA ligase (NAD+)
VEFFREERNREVIDELSDLGVRVERKTGSEKLEGKTFLFTGSLDGFTRAEAKEVVEKAGGRSVSTASDKVDYVIVGNEPGSKLDDARRIGLEIMDEKGFRELIED